MSGWLLDTNVLLGCGWKSHENHESLLNWLALTEDWVTCSITESGFIRVSMSPAYRASFADAQASLRSLRATRGHRFLSDDISASQLPTLSSSKDTTDAHLVILAKRHNLKLATLDKSLTLKPWAAGVAKNPL